MVRLWSKEVGNARSVIKPLVLRVDPSLRIDVDGGEGLRNDTAEVRLHKGKREARCVVTFEAWEHARKHPEGMEAAIREIVGVMEAEGPLPAFLTTSRGLATEPAGRDTGTLRDLAASTEADVLAERLPTRARE